MKKPVLNLKINPDLKEAVKSIQGLGSAVGSVKIQAEIIPQKLKPIKVDVAFQGVGESLGTIAAQRFIGGVSGVKVGFDVRQLEDAGNAISSKIAREISRASGGGFGGGILRAIGGVATAPLRVAQQAISSTLEGAIFGITRELTTDLGKGIRQSIDAATGGTIGSTELLGRRASDALFSGIKEGGINKIPGLIESVLSKNPRIAGIGRNLAQQFIDNFELGLAGKTKQLQTAIAAIVPEEERLTASGARKQTQKKQTEFNRAQAQEAIFEQRRAIGRRIQQRGEEIPQQIARLDALVEGVQSNPDFIKEAKNLERRIKQLEKTDTTSFSAQEQSDLKGAIALLTNQYLELIEPLERAARQRQDLQTELGRLDKARSELTRQLKLLEQQSGQLNQPKIVQDIATQLAKNAGINFDPKNLPPIVKASNATLPATAQASYVPEANIIRVRKELFNALQEGVTLTSQQKRLLSEEIAHSLQFDLGSLQGFRDFERQSASNKLSQPTPEDALRLAPELASYAAQGKSKEIIGIEREAKVAADNLVNQTQSIEQQAQDIAELNKKYNQLGLKLRQFIERESGSVQSKISELLPLAEEQGDDAIAEVRRLQHLIDVVQRDSAEMFRLIAAADLGQAPTADIGKIRAELENNVKKIGQIEALATTAEKNLKQKPNTALATVGQAASNIAETIAPAGSMVLRGAEMAGGALGAVAKAGMALADKIGFAASSFIPGGALLYNPVIKPVAKTAAVGGALAAASATVPGAAETLGAITSAISTILAPATGGLAEGIGASVSADIVGALPHLFQSLSGAIAQSGLPGAGFTAQSVELVGGQLTHLLQPVVQGVASTADASIVAVGSAVQHFLADLGTILVAGKGVETGVKLATNPDARAAALQGIQTVGEGAGQFINAIPEAIDKVQTAVERTTQAVQGNIDEIKDAGQRVAQGEIRAVGDIVEASTEAAAHIARGASDVAKASTKAASDIVEGASKVGGVFGKLTSQAIPGVEDLGELSKGQLLNIYNQLTKKLDNVVKAEIEALNATGSAGTGRSGIIRGDLNKIQEVLQQKYQHTIDVVAQEITDEPLYLPSKIDSRELEPVEIEIQKPKEELKLALDTPNQVVIDIPASSIEIEEPDVVLDIPARPTDERDVFAEQVKKIDDSITATERYIRQYYADLANAAESYKKAIKKGATEDAQKAQNNARTASQALFQEINETSRDLANVLESLAEIGIDLSPSEPVRDRIRKLNSEIEAKRKLGTQRLAQVGLPVPTEQPDSLEAIDTTALQNSLDKGAQSLSSALKSLVETIFEVKGQTLKESIALAAQSPRGKDLAVNTVGLAGSIAAGTQGPVAGLAGDLIGALAARQAMGGGSAETFGDITGFLTGNLANKITGIPGSGAAAAAAIVPQLQKLRDQLQAKYGQPIEIPVQLEGLEALDPEVVKARKQIRELDKLIEKLTKNADAALKDLENQTEAYIKEINAGADDLINKQRQRAARRRAEQQAGIDLADQKRLEEGEQAEPTGRRFIVGLTGKVKEEKFNRPGDIKTELQKANLEAKTILETTPGDIKGPDPAELKALTKKVRDAEVRFNLAAEAFEDEIIQLEAGGGSGGGRGGLLGRGIAGAGGGPGGPLNTLKNIGKGFREVAEAAGIPVGPISKLGGLLKGVGVAALAFVAVNSFGDAIVQAGRAAFDTALRMEKLNAQLAFLNGGGQEGTEKAAKDLEFLNKIARDTKQPVLSLAEGYAQLKQSVKGTALEGKALEEIYTALATNARVNNVEAERLKGQQVQLQQVFRKGRADTEDLNTLSENGLSLQRRLQEVTKTSGAEFTKLLESGGITADKVAKAIKLIGDDALPGLAVANKTASAAIGEFQRRLEALNNAVGPAILGGFSAVVSGVVAGIGVLEDTGRRLEPVFGTIAEVGGIIVDIASPIVGALAAINNAARKDLQDGFAAPFLAIRSGLAEIRKGIQFAFGAIGAVLTPVGKALKLLPEGINPATVAMKALGAAIAFIALTQLATVIGGITTALTAMSVANYTKVLPSLIAVRGAALAFIATPMGATLAVIGAAAVVAAANFDGLARSIIGYSKAQQDADERGIAFNKQYTEALDKLSKGIPLTDGEVKSLQNSLNQSVKEGRDSAGVMKTLVGNLNKLQASALAAAEIQGKLTAAMNASKKAIKSVSKEIDADYATRETALNESLANQQITRDRFDAEEVEAQQKKTKRYEALYEEQAKNLQAALREAQTRLAAPMPTAARSEVLKQVEEIEDQLNDIEKTRGQARIEYLKGVQKQREDIENDRAKRAETTQKTIQTLADAGIKTQGAAEQEVSAIKEAELQRRIKALNGQIDGERNAAGKLTDIGKNLYAERLSLEADLQKSIADRTGIRSKAEAELVDLEEKTQKSIQLLVQGGIATELQGEEEVSRIKEAQIRRRIGLINEELARTSDTGAYNLILANRRELEAELTAVVAEGVNKRYDILLKDVQREQESLAAVVSEVEANALTEIQRLQNRNAYKQKQVDMERLELTKFRLQQELQAQKSYIAELQKLPDPTDPEKRREAENTLRDAKLKTAQITQQLAEQEYQQQEKIREIAIAAIDERIKGQENLTKEAEEFAGVATRALENQNKLLEAQKSLKQSLASYDDAAYKILIDTEKDEEEKARLQEQAAEARLRGLKETQAIERDILELQIEQERVANRVASIKAAAALERAKAEEEKVALNPEATEGDKRAASLTTKAAGLELDALLQAGQLQDRLAQSRRAQADIDDRRERLAARFELANARTDKSQKEEEVERLRGEAARGIRTNRARRAIDMALPTVDLHSGAVASIQKLGDISNEFKQLRQLTSSGVVGNLAQLVNLQKNLSIQLNTLAAQPRVTQNITNNPPGRSRVLAGSKN
ncbi:MAG: tape measure protein [Microcoleus sp.]